MGLNPKEKKTRERKEAWESAPGLRSVSRIIKTARKSRDTEDPVDVLLYDPLAVRLTHGFIKAHWSANAVTILSLFVGLTGSILFFPQNRWINLIGILLEIFAAVLDCCDGMIARLTHTSSQLGRVLDGAVDILNFLAIYIVLGLRMMKETIPFTGGIPWSFYIWIVILVTMICHAGQARMADYFRGLHLFFLKGSDSALQARSKRLKAELKSLPKGSPFYERAYRVIYLIYTRSQERWTPHTQKLLDEMEEAGASEELRSTYVTRSRRYIQLTNALTYNIRTYALFILLLCGLHTFYFPFVILAMEALKLFMVGKYEGIAKRVYQEYYAVGEDAEPAGGNADGNA